MRVVQSILFVLLVSSVTLIFVLCHGPHSPLLMHAGGRFVLESVSSLAFYMLVVAFAKRIVILPEAWIIGTVLGVIGGLVQVLHMSLETFGSHIGDRSDVTALFMAASFALWLIVGFWVALRTRQYGQAVLGASWSAATNMIIAVSYGVVLSVAGYPDSDYIASWPEFKESGWRDAQSFGIANTMDALVSHLVIGPVVGILLGATGVVVAVALRKAINYQRNAHEA